ncbi:CerR family C-terminal domain-containing protein [Sphingomonas immobilis]|uniref:CerR family C-terminal domain-containing protein n=1 Tax=Sphingomonas immobilis TaxID=3063997 RepID=A0ABT8ZUE0_9SPHN|nr:CerR family C-terminal domain-containing protein [Sphingomonas sp. CA1-15]MDO7841198.1 CerR family C-terminal domain-containing protein [Sphingomonas sp. CA1-15]
MVQQRLLDIAIREFGEKGLDGASTRGIASAAGTAMSSITYHYGGKEGLYLAAAEHIAAQMVAEMVPDVALDGAVPTDPAEARVAIRRMLEVFVDRLASERHPGWGLFIVREQLHPTAAFDKLYEGAMGPAIERLVELVCVASGVRDRATARIAGFTMFSQIIATKSLRASMLKMMGRETFDDTLVEAIRLRIVANAEAIIDRLIAERQEAA